MPIKSKVPLFDRAVRDRLRRWISLHEARLAREDEALALLSARLERGQTFERDLVPPGVVTLDSRVRLRDADSGRCYVTTVTLPLGQNEGCHGPLLRHFPKLALLGARVGDDIVWRSAGRLRRARIERLLPQPESLRRGERRPALTASPIAVQSDHLLRENLTSGMGKSN
jgi:regulator of nucleoside diphosphate kinase